jgi:hypothetical protein
MARIADKHGLTNPYREKGYKRHIKRGRPRKYLLGAPKKLTKKEKAIMLKFLKATLFFLCFLLLTTLAVALFSGYIF